MTLTTTVRFRLKLTLSESNQLCRMFQDLGEPHTTRLMKIVRLSQLTTLELNDVLELKEALQNSLPDWTADDTCLAERLFTMLPDYSWIRQTIGMTR